jgi:hypothetical protein
VSSEPWVMKLVLSNLGLVKVSFEVGRFYVGQFSQFFLGSRVEVIW